MDSIISLDLAFRWSHVLFGMTWIGLLYYFNFIQGEYFKEAEPDAKADATKKLAPRALWWFRWAAMFTFITGILLIEIIRKANGLDAFIVMGAIMGTIMMLNVWLIIWPNQKIVCGIVEGDAAAAGPKALLASRTNTLLSFPMLLGMMGSSHADSSQQASYLITNSMSTGFMVVLALIVVIELNAIFGKVGPMASVKGVIHSGIGLTVVCLALLQLV
jgi:uncharacterized membrane protein